MFVVGLCNACVRDSPNGTIGYSTNGTIGSQSTLNVSRQRMVPLVSVIPLVETLIPMVPLVVQMVTLVSPNGVNSNIMIIFIYTEGNKFSNF